MEGQRQKFFSYWNPINISSRDLMLLDSQGNNVRSDFDVANLLDNKKLSPCEKTRGSITLTFNYKVLASGKMDIRKWQDGWNTDIPSVPTDPFFIEENAHHASSDSSTIYDHAQADYSDSHTMRFAWDNCTEGAAPKYSMEKELEFGPYRAGRARTPFDDTMYFPSQNKK
jgi:hypothetical protein